MIDARQDNRATPQGRDHADDTVVLTVVGHDLRVLEVGAALAALSALPAAELRGRTIGELEPALGALVEPSLRQVFLTGEPVALVEGDAYGQAAGWISFLPVRSRGGAVVAVDVVARAGAMRWEGLRPLTGGGQEPGASRAADATLEASEASLALALEAGHAGTFDWEISTNRNRWSPQLEALYGLAPGAFEGTYEGWASRVEPEDVRAVEAGIGEALRERRPEYAYEFRAILPDGERRWLAGRARFTYDAGGAPVRMLGINVDINERKRGEEALRRAHERLAFALERLDGFLYDYDLIAGTAERSDGFARVLGYDPASLPAYSGWWGEQIHPEDRARAIAEGRAAQSSDAASYSLEYRVRHRDGHYLTVWDRGQIERDAEGRATRVLGTTINISERRQAAAERAALLEQVQAALRTTEAALARAEEATRERDLLISIAAHDLRTPLTVILGQARRLQRASESSIPEERMRRTLGTIADQAARLNLMIEALLDLSRIQEGRLTIRPAPHDLVELLGRVVGEVQSTVSTHRLTLAAPAGPLVVNGELPRLEQVFFNLLGNAVKYSPEGGAIEVTLATTAEKVRVRISDKGIGIPAEALPHLFTRFYRAPNAGAQTTSSMGVGLYIVRELVVAHGGSVEVESTEGAGSTFTVELPLAELVVARSHHYEATS